MKKIFVGSVAALTAGLMLIPGATPAQASCTQLAQVVATDLPVSPPSTGIQLPNCTEMWTCYAISTVKSRHELTDKAIADPNCIM